MQEVTPDNSFTWKDLLWDCIAHWRWFVLSLVICLLVAVFKIACSNDIYETKASVLIKTEDRSASMSMARDAFNMMGFGSLGSNVHNEMLTMASPTLMAEVVEKLRLNEVFTVQNGLREEDLYKREPLIVVFEKPETLGMIFMMDIEIVSDSVFLLSDITVGKTEYSDNVETVAGNYAQSPVGRVLVSPSVHFSDDMIGKTIHYMRTMPLVSAEIYSAQLNITLPDREASVIRLSLQDASMVKSIDLLNTLIDTYNHNWVLHENAKITSISEMVNDRIDRTLKELNEAEDNISSYMAVNLVSDFNQAASAYFTQNLELNKEIVTNRTQVNIAKAMLASLSEAEFLTLPSNSGLSDGAIVSQIQEYNQLVLERNKLMENTSANNQIVQNITKSLQLIREGVEKSLEGLIENTNIIVSSLEKQQTSIQQKLSNTPKEALHLANVQREQKIKEELYLFLLEKREENDMSQSFASDNSRVIEYPHSSLLPVAPNKRLIILAALIVALALPVTILLIMALLDTTVHGKKDVESLKTAYLGEVPLVNRTKRWRFLPSWLQSMPWKKNEDSYEVLVKKNNRNVVNESFRILRTKLDFINKSADNKLFVVTSIQPGSGKSFISMNFAASYALKGSRVLVIDMDLRRATSSHYVSGAKHAKGIADYLSENDDDYSDIIIRNPIVDGMDVIPVGTMPPNPAELILSDRLSSLLGKLRDEYDLIFLDCPPIDIVAESGEIARFADMALFVVRAGLFEKGLLPEIDDLSKKKVFKNMVVLLNGVSDSGHYGYGKYGRYGRYGYSKYGYYNDKE